MDARSQARASQISRDAISVSRFLDKSLRVENSALVYVHTMLLALFSSGSLGTMTENRGSSLRKNFCSAVPTNIPPGIDPTTLAKMWRVYCCRQIETDAMKPERASGC